MCYSMLGISQQLLFAWVMRPYYTLLDGALFLHPSIGFLSDLLPKQGIASAHILGSKPSDTDYSVGALMSGLTSHPGPRV